MIFGDREMLSKFYEYKIEFFDVDSMDVMWHGNYVKYLESARCAMLDDIGCNYMAMRENGFCLPVIKLDIKYIKYIKFNQKIKIQIKVLDFDTILRLQYKIYDFASDELLSIANTAQVAVDIKSKETLFDLPAILKNAIKTLGDK